MEWIISQLESIACLYNFKGNEQRISEIKRAITAIQKNHNVFYFPEVMNFIQIERQPHNAHEPGVGAEIFGMFRYKDTNGPQGPQGFQDKIGQCIYTWQEKDNPEEIFAYAQGIAPGFSAGERWMPCRKNTSDKYLIICTSKCCQQPKQIK